MGLLDMFWPPLVPPDTVVLSSTPTMDRVRKLGEAFAPADRFVDVTWEEWEQLRIECACMAPFLARAYEFGPKGLRLRPHVYARPPNTVPPSDPVLVAQVHEVVRTADALLRKIGGAA